MIFPDLKVCFNAVCDSVLKKNCKPLKDTKKITFMAEDNDELFKLVRPRLLHHYEVNPFYFYEILNTDGAIIFLFAGTQEECIELKEHFQLGTIVKSNIYSRTRPGYFSNTVAGIKAIKKKISSASLYEILLKFHSVENLTGYIPSSLAALDNDTDSIASIENNILKDDLKSDIVNPPESVSESTFLTEDNLLEEELKSSTEGLETAAPHSLEQSIMISKPDCNYLEDEEFSPLVLAAKTLVSTYNKLEARSRDYCRTIKACDYKTLDMLHDIELKFDKMNAAQGYAFAKELHRIRIFRRNVKDKLQILTDFSTYVSQINTEKISELEESLSNRRYSNRVNSGMFDLEKFSKKVEANSDFLDSL